MGAATVLIAIIAGQAPPEPRQTVAFSCGPHSLSLAARLSEHPLDETALRRAFGRADLNGPCSLEDIRAAAAALGLSTEVIRLDPKKLRDTNTARAPLIAALRADAPGRPAHFVVFYGRLEDGSGLQMLDYPARPLRADWTFLADRWDGIGLYVTGSPEELPTGRRAAFIRFVHYAGWTAFAVGMTGFVTTLRRSKRRRT